MVISTKVFAGIMLATSTFLASCQKDDPASKTENVVFGHFYGECGGERCIEIYKLDTSKQELSEDTQDKYPLGNLPYDGTYVTLASGSYQQVQDLPQLIPAQLLRQADGSIGSPDAGDWGGYYLEVTANGRRRFWFIDTQKTSIPAYLHPLVDTLAARIQKLP